MQKIDVLRALKFGERIAEEELGTLEKYFVETDQWEKMFAGEVDVVYGPKGSGKSALYSLLNARQDKLFDRGVMVISGENPRGTPVFKDLSLDPPASEVEFNGLWKLFLLALIGNFLLSQGAQSDDAKRLLKYLEANRLVHTGLSLAKILGAAREYVKTALRGPKSAQAGFEIEPETGHPKGVAFKIVFRDPTAAEMQSDIKSVDELLEMSNAALRQLEVKLWVLLDRLDVAFAEHSGLEENALRALFRVYLDLNGFDNIRLKIFLRTDIWNRITNAGFREASHVTRSVTISWDKKSLLNLVIRRALQNPSFVLFYKVDPAAVMRSAELQEQLFYRAFPNQIKLGNNPATFDWLCSRTQDGTKYTAPRELIHLLNASRDEQLRALERGEQEPEGEKLFGRDAIRKALREVSVFRLVNTLYAEYPSLKPYIVKLKGQKTLQNAKSLAAIWTTTEPDASSHADQLVEVGFFESRGEANNPEYWVPFLYREALDMVQGEAD